MTRLTPRLRWRKAVGSDAFPKGERVVRGTLLCLVELMTPVGELRAWREEMVDATGLPPRTLDRHLARAVETGWLIRETPAGKRRMAVYLAAIPADGPDSSVRHFWRAGDEFCAPSARIQNSSSVRHLVANSIKKSPSDSEGAAVDRHRGRRTEHDDGREERDHDVTSQAGTDRSWLPTPLRRSSYDRTGDVA